MVSWVRDRSGTWEGLAHGSRLSQAIPTPQLDGSVEDNLDLPHRSLADSSADLSCDSRVNSDYETDGEGYTDGEGHTDGEGGPHTDVDEGPPAPALARSSEPVLADEPQSPKDHGRSSGVRGAQVSRTWGGPSKGLGIGQTHVGSRCSPRTSTETSLIRSASGTWATNQSLTADALTAAPFPYRGYRADATSPAVAGWRVHRDTARALPTVAGDSTVATVYPALVPRGAPVRERDTGGPPSGPSRRA